MEIWLGHLVYLLALVAFGLALPPVVWEPGAREFIFIVGFIAIWRYSWGLLNLVRFLIYKHRVFPRLRRRTDELGEAGLPPHVYLLVTSFRIGTETTRRVYDSVFRAAVAYQRPVTVIASIVERADEAFVKQLFQVHAPGPHIKLVFVRIAGTGKRDALACGFRAISKQCPSPGAIAAVIDGDSMVPTNIIERCAPLFALMPELGALTTDETCEVEGNRIFREWYNLRFAQRHIFMGSVSLSCRVLTLTGRMSMFRADLITDPDFIHAVELDWIDHWRLGRFKFLTGDDKSSWYYLLKHGIPMLYVPDTTVVTIETPPDPSFLRSSLVLMRRWFGNMLRTNARAIALGPRAIGSWFTWLCIMDQRVSMWTSLTGLFAALLATIAITPMAAVYYLFWIMLTRYVWTLSLLLSRPHVTVFYPFLLYYNQIIGSLVKTIVLFRLDKQKWTRQNTVLDSTRTRFADRLAAWSSSYMHAFAMTVFLVLLATATHIIEVPDVHWWIHKMKG